MRYDVIIVGGGHNGLVAACYLAKSGLTVLLLERRPNLGGAAISRQIFSGFDVPFSEYSYLVSLFPQKVIEDLRLSFRVKRRQVASFTPIINNGSIQALLVSNVSPKTTRDSFITFTGGDEEYKRYRRFLYYTHILAKRIWPTLLEPLMSRRAMERRFADEDGRIAWRMFIEDPLGEAVEQCLDNDAVRGSVFTDAKIGILTHPHDSTLLQNRTFLYHVIGNGRGEWRVPVGGMGRLITELENYARKAGVVIKTNAVVEKVDPGKKFSTIQYSEASKKYVVEARFVLSNVARSIFSRMFVSKRDIQETEREGSVFKINMLLKRLPKLATKDYPSSDAFTGTFHIDEGYQQMKETYKAVSYDIIPQNPAGEMYCHTLTDGSILPQDLRRAGYHSLGLFGIDMPYRLFLNNNEGMKEKVSKHYFRSINKYLQEPIEDCIARSQDDKPCINVKSPVDIESELGMPKGNIFHGELSWPFLENDCIDGERWGVETVFDHIFVCGSSALRGGCVSGIPGHNAAMKVLSVLKRA